MIKNRRLILIKWGQMVSGQAPLPGETAACTSIGVGLSIIITGGIPSSELSIGHVLPIAAAFAGLVAFALVGQFLAYAIITRDSRLTWRSSRILGLLLFTFFCWRSVKLETSFIDVLLTFSVKPDVHTILIVCLLLVWLAYFIGAAFVVRRAAAKGGSRE